jgi:hypothetical protein
MAYATDYKRTYIDVLGPTAMTGKLHKLTAGSSECVHGMGGTEPKDNSPFAVSLAFNLVNLRRLNQTYM